MTHALSFEKGSTASTPNNVIAGAAAASWRIRIWTKEFSSEEPFMIAQRIVIPSALKEESAPWSSVAARAGLSAIKTIRRTAQRNV